MLTILGLLWLGLFLSSGRVFRRSQGECVGPASPPSISRLPSALALGDGRGLWLGSEVRGWETSGWGTEMMCQGVFGPAATQCVDTHTHVGAHFLMGASVHTCSCFFSSVQPMGRAFGARVLITLGNSDFGHLEEGWPSQQIWGSPGWLSQMLKRAGKEIGRESRGRGGW